MAKILIITDTHIVEKWFEEIGETFLEVLHQEADRLVIAGDYFHKPYPTLKELIFGAKWLAEFKEHFSKVVTVIGNHDRKDGVSSLDIFAPFGIEVKDDYIIQDRKYKAYVGHFFTDQSIDWNIAKVKLETLKGYNHIILGHYHMFKILSGTTTNPIAFHPGSFRYVRFDETSQKQKVITMVDTKTKQVKFIPLKSPIPMIDIYSIKELKKLVENHGKKR